jgi:hypothetical protein
MQTKRGKNINTNQEIAELLCANGSEGSGGEASERTRV